MHPGDYGHPQKQASDIQSYHSIPSTIPSLTSYQLFKAKTNSSLSRILLYAFSKKRHNNPMLIRFLIYGLLGWSLEIVWTGFLSGIGGDPRLQATTYLWMFPIYGTAILLEPIHNSIRQWPFWVRGILWVVAIWTIEYISGGIIRYLTGPVSYTHLDVYKRQSRSNGSNNRRQGRGTVKHHLCLKFPLGQMLAITCSTITTASKQQ